MATTEELQAQLDALKKARANGHKRVTYGDRTVEYRDMRELNDAISAIERELADSLGGSVVRRYSFVHDKGL
jgi:hypothetical protein